MFRSLRLFWILVFFCACNTAERDAKSSNVESNDSVPMEEASALPVTKVLSELPDSLQPEVFRLDTMPKPILIGLPHKAAGSYSMPDAKGEMKEIALVPPALFALPVLKSKDDQIILDGNGEPYILGEGGKSHITTYTTDDGLLMDDVKCMLVDQQGNIWIGTKGAGVSKYDGKKFTSYTTAHGLVNNNVWCIFEDSHHTIWFGTNGGGLSKFDGKMFTNYTMAQGLAKNSVTCAVEDNNGVLWFGTGGGVSKYDPNATKKDSAGLFVNYTTKDGLAHAIVLDIAIDKSGDVWCATSGGASRLRTSTSGENEKLRIENFYDKNGLGSNLTRCIIKDSDGELWFGTDGGFSKLDLGQNQSNDTVSFLNYNMTNGLASNLVSCATLDSKGKIWLGTSGGGISEFNLEAAKNGEANLFKTYTTVNGLSADFIQCIEEDKVGNIWIGTVNGGLCKYAGPACKNYGKEEGLGDNVIRSIAEDKSGNLWFATMNGGISKMDGKSVVTYTTGQGLPTNSTMAVAEDHQGNMWFGSQVGVTKFDGVTFTTYTKTQGLAHQVVRSIFVDSRGDVWFGTNGGGVSKFDGMTFTNYTTRQGLGNNTVRSIAEDYQGRMWFGTYGGGVTMFDGSRMTTYTTKHGLTKDFVISILNDSNGTLWFGTDGGGVCRMKSAMDGEKQSGQENGKDNILFENLSTTHGLADNVVYAMVQDKKGNILIGTNLGLTMIPFDACQLAFTEVESRLEYFNFPHGYPIKDINTNAMLCDSKGIVWAGTGSDKTGLIRLDLDKVTRNQNPPQVFIHQVKINDESVVWSDLNSEMRSDADDTLSVPPNITEEVTYLGKELMPSERDDLAQRFVGIRFDGISAFYNLPQNLELPYNCNSVSFDFNATETGRNYLVRYSHILEGYSKEWSPETDLTNAVFGNIDEGKYKFKLKAKGPDGVWSEPVSFDFVVLPPWYRTLWAYIIYLILFIAAFIGIVKWRERKLIREKERLERTVELRTAEVVEEKKEVEKQKAVVEKEKQRSEELLLNILPAEVAEELKEKGSAEAKMMDEVTVLFTDFKGFTQLSEKLTPKELVSEINECFSAFDHIMMKHGVEKIKTIGDAYMAAGGIPSANSTHASDVVAAALEIQQFMLDHKQSKMAEGQLYFEIRIGVHTGPVVAGIVGVKKFAYDIWGDTVNTASRMESSGEAGKVNISATTYELVKNEFACMYRGKVSAKGKGDIDMYFVESRS